MSDCTTELGNEEKEVQTENNNEEYDFSCFEVGTTLQNSIVPTVNVLPRLLRIIVSTTAGFLSVVLTRPVA